MYQWIRAAFFTLLFIFCWSMTTNALARESNKKVVRIISLSPCHTEILLRLGAKDNIVGISEIETYHGLDIDGWKPKIYGLSDDVKKFKAAKADYVLLQPVHLAAAEDLIRKLNASGIKVKCPHASNAGDIYRYWRDLASLVGREKEAEDMIAAFDQDIRTYYQAANRLKEQDKPGVFIEAKHHNVKTYVPDSIAVWLVEIAGGRNIASDAKASSPMTLIADYGPERLAAKGSHIDIYIFQVDHTRSPSLKNTRARGIYKPVKAFNTGKTIEISEEFLSRPTPSLLIGLKQISELTGLNPDPKTTETQE